MRINVYSQELTDETRLIAKKSNGRIVTGSPCYPNRERAGLPRRPLPEFLVDIWRKNGCPSFQDATDPFDDVREESVVYHAVQLVLHSSPLLHHPPQDDDRSAVTFWLPKSTVRRESFAKALEALAVLVRNAPVETGLD